MLLVSEKGKSLKGLKDDFGLLDFIIAKAIGKVKAVSSEMFIRNFQFKILRNTVFTNSRPIKIGVPDDICTFCRGEYLSFK